MHKKVIKFTDYNGVEREEEHYFNLTEAELTFMEMSEVGGFKNKMQRIIQAQDGPALIQAFRDIIRRSYGIKSPDGRQFIKSDEIFKEFEQTPAYSELIMELLSDEHKAAEFIAKVLPQDRVKKMADRNTAVTPIGN